MKLDRPKYKNFKPGNFPTCEDGFDVCELKYDGWWGQLVLENYNWTLYSRTGRLLKTGLLVNQHDHVKELRTVLHGEYIVGTEWAKQHPEYYGQFAVFGLENTLLSNHQQRQALFPILSRLEQEEFVPGLFLVPQFSIEQASTVWDINDGFEGLVFKNSQAPWGNPFGRMKREATMDYVCTGFIESNADRHKGWGVASIVGGLFVDGSLVTDVCATSSLSDEQRRDFYDNPGRYTGQVFEVKGKKITKTGSMRHPDFVRWRPDKRPEECVWSTKK
jgi:ATP-dependent DNA ligase